MTQPVPRPELAAELEAARAGVALRDLSARELLRLTGEDRATFLHGMVTNEVNKLPDDGVTYAAMLTPKGAMVGDARIWRLPGSFLVETEPGNGEPTRAFLEKYLISEDVELSPAPELAVLALLGPRTEEALAHALGPLGAPASGRARTATFEGAEVRLAASHLAGLPGCDLLVPRALLPALRAKLEASATPVGEGAWEVLRVEAGVPRYGFDLEATTIPLEANLERAISYDKGCYIGQEVIARATFRGHVNRKLTGLWFEGDPPARHAELKKGEKKVGFVTSVVFSPTFDQHLGLGYVQRDSLVPGTELEVGGAKAVVAELPFRR